MSNREITENMASINYMHNKIMGLGNEYAEEVWFMVYPDGADREEVAQMARDNETMEWLRETYQKIMKVYA